MGKTPKRKDQNDSGDTSPEGQGAKHRDEDRRAEFGVLFGTVLRSERIEAGLTQAQLAERADLHDTYISLLERGRRQPSLEALLRLARALGVEGAALVREVEARFRSQRE